MTPAISVITVSRNAAATITQTLASVAAQEGVAVEHLVVDGGSSDGTAEIISAHAGQLAFWVSEPDQGIAEAMNKGIAAARGEWLFFLQADDFLLEPESLRRAAAECRARPDAMVAFPVRWISRAGGTIRDVPAEGAGLKSRFKQIVRHQGLFVPRHVFERVGPFDPRYRVLMDLEHLFRARAAGAPLVAVGGAPVAAMRDGGISSRRDWSGLRERLLEERELHRRYARGAGWRLAYECFSLAYLSYRWLRARWPGTSSYAVGPQA